MAKKIIRTTRKGQTPFNKSILDILKVFRTRKKLIPIGGVIKAISMFTTNRTPNHKVSKPRAVIIGTKMGTVKNIIVIPSMKQPKKSRKTIMAITTNIGVKWAEATKTVSFSARAELPNT